VIYPPSTVAQSFRHFDVVHVLSALTADTQAEVADPPAAAGASSGPHVSRQAFVQPHFCWHDPNEAQADSNPDISDAQLDSMQLVHSVLPPVTSDGSDAQASAPDRMPPLLPLLPPPPALLQPLAIVVVARTAARAK
jgi:hypothetical protein